MHSQLIQYILL